MLAKSLKLEKRDPCWHVRFWSGFFLNEKGKQNDHIELMKQIENGLCSFYSANKPAKKEKKEPQATTHEPEKLTPPFDKPFARVNSVMAGSPAAEVFLSFFFLSHS
jgi:hypothetical protein